MQYLKRFGFFILTNVLVVTTIGIILKVFNVQPYMTAYGVNYTSLLIYCFIWGMAGSFISLLLSRFMAKMTMGMKPLDQNDAEYGWVVQRVYQYAKVAGISTMPEVCVYNSPEVNAFATGPTRNRSLVAVSKGLIQAMSREEVEGVIAHEVAHIENGDMVTMTLIQGVVNAFALFLAKIVSMALSNNKDRRGWMDFMIQQALYMFFSFLGMFVISAFSRWREFRADAGGARLAGRNKMIGALEKLQSNYNRVDNGNASLATMKIAGLPKFTQLLSTHPTLESRIDALKKAL